MQLRATKELDRSKISGSSRRAWRPSAHLAQSVVGGRGAYRAGKSASGHALQVVFSPATQQLIASGSLGIMQGAKGALPIAVDQVGRIRESAG